MRKKSNRYIPDRKAQVRRWVRRIKTAFALLMVPPALLIFSAVLARAYHALLDGPWFRLEEVEISGLKTVERGEILNALGIPRNASLLTMDISERAKALNAIPWLLASSVKVDWPHRVMVEVTEREPFAVVFADRFLVMDADGGLFAETAPNEHPSLPLVTGFSGSGLKVGDRLPAEPLEGVKRLMAALAATRGWFPLNQISECRWHNEEGIILYTTVKAIPIELGWEDYELKLGRLQKVLGHLSQRQLLEGVTRIDLDYPNRAFVSGDFPAPKGI
ncbi:MAG: FtsQ-type POTRA domain-containing protein [Syntrophobacteraceae bacterium]|jgi:cell division septal protein FtsQ|nr:FtsQ-type POTRA domain-containing protein [Syntrophobacteraceae bacterium]